MLQRFILCGLATIAALASSPALSITPAAHWKDSYSVGNQCYCVTTYDHGAGTIEVDTPAGVKTVIEICETIGPGPGVGTNPIYNDVQCGNGPANESADERICPGRVDLGEEGCSVIGPTWNLDQFFTAPGAATTGDTSDGTTDGLTDGSTTAGTDTGSTDGSTGATTQGTTGGTTTSDTTTGDTTDGTTDPVVETELPPEGILFEAETAVIADNRWFTSTTDTPQLDTSSDPDANHSVNAGGTTYLELLPDTLVIASDAVTVDNQWNEPGFGPVLQYDIDVPEAGVYEIAVRGYATGEFDRRIHAGVDGLWTSTSDNITLCETDRWSWSNCNDAVNTVEFSSAGIHQLLFSAADDGFELDQFVLSRLAGEAISTEPETDSEAEPELAEAVSVGEGVAFGAALAHGFLFFAGLILLLRRRTAQQ